MMLEKNIRILKARFPEVYKRILEVGSREPLHFRYGDGNSTKELLSVNGKHTFPTFSDGKKEELIELWFSGLRLQSEAIYSLTGFGDGSHVRYFLKNSSGGNYALVAEKDPALLRDTFSRIDCSDILANDRFILGTGECDEDFFRDLKDAAMLKVTEINNIVFSPLHCVDEAYYDKARNEMVRQYLVIRPLMEVNLRTGMNLQQNTLENMKHMAGSPDVGELAGLFEDVPFILVGAGPSLDESIDFLKFMQDKAIICVSNSPFRKLVNSGIRPHLAVTADPLSPTLRGFENVEIEGIPLACPFSAYPEIVSRFSGRILSWSTYNPIVDILKASTGRPPGTEIMEQGTVSGCVLDIGRLLGCKKIFLVGQDMCVRDDGKYYTDDSTYSDDGRDFTKNMDGHRLPGNTIDEVIVEGRLFVYLKTFEKFIQVNKHIEFINLARTGVKIEGVPYMTYEDAIATINPDISSSTFDQKITTLLENQLEVSDLTECFQGLITHVEKLFQASLDLAVKSERLPPKFSGSNYSSNKEVLRLLDAGNKVNKIVDSNKKYWEAILDGRTKGELALYKRIIREIDFPNQNWKLIQQNKEYYWALSSGCYWFLDTLLENLSASRVQ
jgi:hypothetical protein